MFKDQLKNIMLNDGEVLPLVEGGKGVAASDGVSAGAWAACGGVGTFSAVNAHIPGKEELSSLQSFSSKNRFERHREMITRAIEGGIAQAKIAYEEARHRGRIHMNVMWEMGGCEEILNGILSKVKNLIHGVTCGAGMPFRLAEICAKYNVKFYPIVSSSRAFSILWRRAYHKFSQWLGGIVYEDPWLAGGHNGLSTHEDENHPELPKPRVRELRKTLESFDLKDTLPIIMAGGVWCLSEWKDWLNDPELGSIAFQFGTRPLLTKESPIPDTWKQRLLTLKKGDIALNRFSPTGFPSSAVKNPFLQELQERSERQVAFAQDADEQFCEAFSLTSSSFDPEQKGRCVFLKASDRVDVERWQKEGFSIGLATPSRTLIFVTKEKSQEITCDRQNCIGCLSACHFSGWNQDPESPARIIPDPRSFCIQKTLQSIVTIGDVDHDLMFCGHQGYRFATDPFYQNGFIPTVKELVERIQTGQ